MRGVDVSAVGRDVDACAGSRHTLHTNKNSHAGSVFIRLSSGSNNGWLPTLATVTGYCSFMETTPSLLPSTACSGGRYASSRYVPSDGAAPAVVTRDGRPWASMMRSPSGVTIGSLPPVG